jgi:hypothetical protein
LRRTERETLLALKGFGVKCLAEVDRFLEVNGLPNTEFGSSDASVGQFAEKSIRFEALSEQTQALLRQSGITMLEGLRSRNLREVLEATRYDEKATDEVGLLCGLPAPRDEHDVLALFCSSQVARDALTHLT